MESYPPNSNKSKRPTDEAHGPKKVERITKGDAIVQKRSLRKRFSETFVGGDTRGVASYVLLEVLIPAVKDTIADAMSQGIERMLFGEARSTSRRPANRYGGGQSYTAYNRMGTNVTSAARQDPRGGMSRRSRATHNFEEIVIPTRGEAEEVLDRLFEVVNKYESVSVADLYEMVGIPSDFTDDKWGWTSDGGLIGSAVRRVRLGYLLDLPRPEPLE